VAAVLGIADLLANGPKRAAELAQIIGSHGRTLYRILGTLVAAGVLVEDKAGRFRLTALGQPLRSDAADSVRAASIFLSGESEPEGASHRLRAEGQDSHRTGLWDHELDRALFGNQRAAVFNAAMTARSNGALCWPLGATNIVSPSDWRPDVRATPSRAQKSQVLHGADNQFWLAKGILQHGIGSSQHSACRRRTEIKRG
jgi:hypothetical protein